MKRRQFLRHSAFLAAAPWILPSGRLFAPQSERKVNHVVLCLFAGGIRNLESVQEKEGSLMPYTLGSKSGISSDILPGMDRLPEFEGNPLRNEGTLFKNFRYSSTQTIHFNGHATALMGAYSPLIQIMKPLPAPTVFELYRKHNSPAQTAMNAWWISDQGGPFSFLNYSAHPDYGADYGANMLYAPSLFKNSFPENGFPLNQEEQKSSTEIRNYIDKLNASSGIISESRVSNSEENRIRISTFLKSIFEENQNGKFKDPWNIGPAMNDDLLNIQTAIRVLQAFQPELLVVNMQDSDIAHSHFTQYCNNIRKADFGLYQLWTAIQQIPEMKDDTVLIAMPEFGRNLEPNTRRDEYGRLALDHTGDPTSQEIFCLILGPPKIIRQNQAIDQVTGNTIDVVPTIAHLLGFEQEIPKGLLNGNLLKEALA